MSTNPQLKEHHIEVTRTARYFTLGDLNTAKEIWIVLHGHRDLASNFIRIFAPLADKKSFIIAPEALMRQYVKGDGGTVGASWMTKEDRESDIKDYVVYLDKLYNDVIEPAVKIYNLKVNGLGFSQGAATLSRWLSLGKAKIDKAVFWVGSLAHDVDFSKAENFKNTEIHLVFASNDPYYDSSSFPNEQKKILTEIGLEPNTYLFNGVHEINAEFMREAGVI